MPAQLQLCSSLHLVAIAVAPHCMGLRAVLVVAFCKVGLVVDCVVVLVVASCKVALVVVLAVVVVVVAVSLVVLP